MPKKSKTPVSRESVKSMVSDALKGNRDKGTPKGKKQKNG